MTYFATYILRYGFKSTSHPQLFLNNRYAVMLFDSSYCLVNVDAEEVTTCYSIEDLEDVLEAKFGGDIVNL